MSDLFSQDAELAVLSVIINNPDAVYNLNGLRFFMFSSTANQLLFSKIEDLVDKNLVPDTSILLASLDASGNLAKAGGKEYLDYLVKSNFPKENLQEYISLVSASHKARSLISLASSVKADQITLDNVDDKLRALRDGLDGISDNSVGGQTLHISEGANSAYDEIVARVTSPGIRGVPWGFAKVDNITGGKNAGELWYIAGRPGAGKTAVASNAVLNDGYSGNPCLLFSKEMNYITMMERLVAIDSGIPITNIRLGLLNQESIDKVYESFKRIKQLPIYLDTNFMMDDYYIESAIKKFTNTKGIKTVYIDYMQLIAERDENMIHSLGRISRMLKTYANGLKISVVALSQLNREVEHRDNKRPVMSDIKQSGSLEEDADLVVGLYRDEYYNKDTKYPGLMEFIILKNRNGPTGTITLDFKPDTNKISGG